MNPQLGKPDRGILGTEHARSAALAAQFERVRLQTERLAHPLSAEDCALQSMPDASPVKWHLAHTAWFFETFILEPAVPGYRLFHPQFRVLFNSYYVALGARHPRPERGLLSRPSLDEVLAYRRHVDERMALLFADAALPPDSGKRVERLEALWHLVVRRGLAGAEQVNAILREGVRGIGLETAILGRVTGTELAIEFAVEAPLGDFRCAHA